MQMYVKIRLFFSAFINPCLHICVKLLEPLPALRILVFLVVSEEQHKSQPLHVHISVLQLLLSITFFID